MRPAASCCLRSPAPCTRCSPPPIHLPEVGSPSTGVRGLAGLLDGSLARQVALRPGQLRSLSLGGEAARQALDGVRGTVSVVAGRRRLVHHIDLVTFDGESRSSDGVHGILREVEELRSRPNQGDPPVRDGEEAGSVELSPHITAELDDQNEIIGMKIIGASKYLRDNILESAQAKLLRMVNDS